MAPGSPRALFRDDKSPDSSGIAPDSPRCVRLGLTALVPERPRMRVWVHARVECLPGDADLNEDW